MPESNKKAPQGKIILERNLFFYQAIVYFA